MEGGEKKCHGGLRVPTSRREPKRRKLCAAAREKGVGSEEEGPRLPRSFGETGPIACHNDEKLFDGGQGRAMNHLRGVSRKQRKKSHTIGELRKVLTQQ